MNKHLLAASAAIVTVAAFAPAYAQQQSEREYAIPSQSVGSALRTFGTASGAQLAFDENEVRGLTSREIRGRFTVDAALSRLLSGTSLRFERMNSGVYSITAQSATASEEAYQVPDVLVRGSQSLNIDIRRSEDDSRPYVTFNAVDIERSQATNVEDFLRDRLPMSNLSADMNSSGRAREADAQSSILLRGFSSSDTLILVDGRPAPQRVTGTIGYNQADVNGIPISSIERIEVLPASSGGMYGSNAIGGVINIILKRNYRGLTISALYKNTFDTDSGNLTYEASGGYSFNEGRTRLNFSASLKDGNMILSGDRPWVDQSRARVLERDPSYFYNQFNPVAGSTPNIRSSGGESLVLDDGRSLGSNITFVPFGYRAGDSLQGFLSNAGRWNFERANDLNGRLAPNSFVPKAYALSGSVRHRFSSAIEGYADLNYAVNDGQNTFAFVSQSLTLLANAPHNPFNQNIRITFPSNGAVGYAETRSRNYRSVVGGTFNLPADWRASLDYTWSGSYFERIATEPLFSDIGLSVLRSGLPAADGRPAINVLQDPGVAPSDFSPYYLPAGNSKGGPIESSNSTTTLRLGGDIGRWLDRTITFAGGAEYSDQSTGELISESYSQFTTPPGSEFYYLGPRYVRSSSAFGSFYMPIFSDPGRIGDVTLSARYDEKSYRITTNFVPLPSRDAPRPDQPAGKHSFDGFNYTAAARIGVTSDLILRASVGTGFTPPDLYSMGSEETAWLAGQFPVYEDPRRGGSTGPFIGSEVDWIERRRGGEDLLPATSETFTAGLIFTPTFLPGFRLSLDYFDIARENEIVDLQPSDFLANEELFPNRIVRENRPLRPDEIAAGYTATPVILLDMGPVNAAKTRVRSLDAQVDYSWDVMGHDFRLYALVSRQFEMSRRLFPDSPDEDLMDFAGSGGMSWRGNGGAEWSNGPFQAGWYTTYLGRIRTYQFSASPSTIATTVGIDGEWVPSQMRHDARFSADLGALSDNEHLQGVRVDLGVQNVFDRKAEVLGTLTLPNTSDFLGRRYSVRLSKTF